MLPFSCHFSGPQVPPGPGVAKELTLNCEEHTQTHSVHPGLGTWAEGSGRGPLPSPCSVCACVCFPGYSVAGVSGGCKSPVTGRISVFTFPVSSLVRLCTKGER